MKRTMICGALYAAVIVFAQIIAIILAPIFCFAESMVYLQKSPVVVTTKLQGPSAYVEVAGVKVDQPIALTTDNTPVWSVLVTDAQLATISKDAAFLGKGLDAVKVNSPTIYNQLTVKTVKLADGMTTNITQATITPAGATVIATDIPIQTYSGWDAKTGTLEAVKPAGEAVKVGK